MKWGSSVADIYCNSWGEGEPLALALGCGLSDHSAIGSLVRVYDLKHNVGFRDAADWLEVKLAMADKGEACYVGMVRSSAYKKLVVYLRRHLKRLGSLAGVRGSITWSSPGRLRLCGVQEWSGIMLGTRIFYLLRSLG